MGLIGPAIAAIVSIARAPGQWLVDRIRERRRRARARAEPDLDRYVADLETAGANVIQATTDETGPRIYAEFAGEWVDLEQRVELEYRLLDETVGVVAVRPGPG